MIEERFTRGNSFLHRASPRVKIVGTAFLIIILAVSRSYSCIFAGLVMGILFVLLARLNPKYLAKRLAAVNLFILLLWLTLPLTGGGESMTNLGPVQISNRGVELALLITIKTNAIILIITSLLSTSPIVHIGRSLQQIGMPQKLTLLLLTTYRYLTLIEQEFQRLRRAATLRCFQPGTNLHTYRTYSYLVGMTLVRSFERSRRVHRAMLMRGFNGSFLNLTATAAKPCDLWLLLLLLGCGLMLAFLGIFW